MAKPYEKGQIVGVVEVIAYLGRRTNVRRQYESVYRVRCTSCGKVQDLTSYDMRSKYACECQKTEVNGLAKKVGEITLDLDAANSPDRQTLDE